MIVISSGCLNLVAAGAKNVSHLSIGSWELPARAHAEWRLSENTGSVGSRQGGSEARMGVTSLGPSSKATHTHNSKHVSLLMSQRLKECKLALPPTDSSACCQGLVQRKNPIRPALCSHFYRQQFKKKKKKLRLQTDRLPTFRLKWFLWLGSRSVWRMTGPKCWIAIDKFAQCHTDSWPSEQTHECCCVRRRKCLPLFWAKTLKTNFNGCSKRMPPLAMNEQEDVLDCFLQNSKNQKSGHTPILDFSDFQCDSTKTIFRGTLYSSHNESLTTTNQPRHRSSFPGSWFPKLKGDDLKSELVICCESILVHSESTPRPRPSVWHSEPPVSTKWEKKLL